MFERLQEKISRENKEEDNVEHIQQNLESYLNRNHDSPEEAKKALLQYKKELKHLERELNILESTDLFTQNREAVRKTLKFIEECRESIRDISEIDTFLSEWVESLSPIKNGNLPDFDSSYEAAEQIESKINNIPDFDKEGKELLNKIDTITEATDDIFQQSTEAKKHLEQIEELSVPGESASGPEKELRRILTETQNMEEVRGELDKIRDKKQEVESELEELDQDTGSLQSLKHKTEKISGLLQKAPEAVFSSNEIDADKRMKELKYSMLVKRNLESLLESISTERSENKSRRDFLFDVGATLTGMSLFSGFATFQNIQAIEESGGGKEQFFSGGEKKYFQYDDGIETVIQGGELLINIIHIRYKQNQPSYDKNKFKRTLSTVFKEDLNIRIKPNFVEIDIRTADIGGSKQYQEMRQELAKLISKTEIGGGIDKDLYSSPKPDSELEKEINSRLARFDKIEDEGILRLPSSEKRFLNLIISDFKEGSYQGLAMGARSRHLALVQDKRNQNITQGICVHELGHKFGLPHSATAYDVMSYSSLARVLEESGRPYFSWESKFNWWKKKNRMSRK